MDGKYKTASDRNLTLRSNTTPKRYSTLPRRISTAKVHFGEAPDDVHICIMCLRAIMNHQVRIEAGQPIYVCLIIDHWVRIEYDWSGYVCLVSDRRVRIEAVQLIYVFLISLTIGSLFN